VYLWLAVSSYDDLTKEGGRLMGLWGVIGLAAATLVLFMIGSGTNAVAAVAAFLFFPAAIAFYFAPAWVAQSRGHRNRMAILVLNLLLGWSVLGWVVALVWAFLSQQAVAVVPAPAPPDAAVPWPSAAHRRVSEERRRPCPHCAESILAAAVVCRFCGRDVPAA
jgi:hypothetical protein